MPERLVIFSEADLLGGAERFVLDLREHLDPALFQVVLAGNRHPRVNEWVEARVGHAERHAIKLHRYETSLLVRARRAFKSRGGAAPLEVAGPSDFDPFEPSGQRLVALKAAVEMAQIPFNIARMTRLFRRLRPDVLHVNNGGYPGSRACQVAPIAARLAGVPRVISFVHHYAVRPDEPRRTIELAIDRRVDAATDAWVTASRDSSARLAEVRDISADKVHTVHLGEQLREPATAADRRAALASIEVPPDRLVIFVVGLLVPRKGQIYAVEALAQLLEAHPNAHLVLVGDGDDRDMLEAQVAQRGLRSNVTFTGYRTDVEGLLAGCDILLHPSPTAELLPYSIKEAMARGLPCVATDVGATRELVEHRTTGLLIPPGDSAAIAEALSMLLDDETLRGDVGAAARERIDQHFSMADAMRKMTAIYNG